MRASQLLVCTCLLGAIAGLAGCQHEPTPQLVDYGAGTRMGLWQGSAGASAFVGGGAGTGATAGNGATAGTGTVTGAGVGGIIASAGVGGVAGSGGMFVGGAGMDAGVGQPTAGTGGTTSSLTSLTFDVMTKSLGGNYAPRNVGAIWIATASGQFVKTLEVWAFIRVGHLERWNAETQGNRIDAISSATLPNHKQHHVTWNLRDANGNAVPDGPYKLVIETNDHNSTGKSFEVAFDKGPGPVTLSVPDQPYYTAMQLVVQ